MHPRLPRLSSTLAVTQHHGTACSGVPLPAPTSEAESPPALLAPRALPASGMLRAPAAAPPQREPGRRAAVPTPGGKSPELGLQSTLERGRRSPAAPEAEGRTVDTDLCWRRLGAACGGGVAIATCQTPALRATAAAPGGQRRAGTRHHTLVPPLSAGDGAGATGHTQRCAATCPEVGTCQQNIKC